MNDIRQLESWMFFNKMDTVINEMNKSGSYIIDQVDRKEYNVNEERRIDLAGGRNYGRYAYDQCNRT